jgi:hypothetical protein
MLLNSEKNTPIVHKIISLAPLQNPLGSLGKQENLVFLTMPREVPGWLQSTPKSLDITFFNKETKYRILF